MQETKLAGFFGSLIEAGWLTALALTPLFFNIYSDRIFEPDKATLLRSLVLIMAAAWGLKQAEGRISAVSGKEAYPPGPVEVIRRFPFWLPYLVVVLSYLVSTATSVHPSLSFFGSYHRLQGTYTTFTYIALALLIFGHLATTEQLTRIIDIVLAVSLCVALYGIIQRLGMDPLLWGADVTKRVAGSLGKSVFLGGYLLMVIPLAVGRWMLHLSDIMAGKRPLGASLVKCSIYTALLAIQLSCMAFTLSRGAWVGLIVALFFFFITYSLVGNHWKALVAIVGLSFLFFIFMVLLNLESSPLRPLKRIRYLDRLGHVFDASSGTARVRVLIWEGAVNMIKEEPSRLLAGWGPETLAISLRPYYSPELAHYERRTAIPDRSHNETFDVLLTRGLMGLASYLLLLTMPFFFGLKWLGIIKTRSDMILWTFLWFSGMSFSCGLFLLWKGIAFLGLALPLGGIFGMAVSFIPFALARRERNKPLGDGDCFDRERKVVLIAILSALAGHFIEINLGIAVTATRSYFWAYLALLAALGGKSLLTSAHAESNPSRRSHGFKEIVIYGLLASLMLGTLAFEFVSNRQGLGSTLAILKAAITTISRKGYAIGSPGIATIGLITWIFIAYLSLFRKNAKRRTMRLPSRMLKEMALFISSSLGTGFIFAYLHASSLLRLGTPPRELHKLVQSLPALLSRYYLFILLVLFVIGWLIATGRSFAKQRAWSANPWRSLGVAVAASAILYFTIVQNIRLVQADIFFKQAKALERFRVLDLSVRFLQEAIRLSPREDQYHLYLGRIQMKRAASSKDPVSRELAFEKSRRALEKALWLNPLNPDHWVNLGRLYYSWSNLTREKGIRQAKLQRSLYYYGRAATLSPNMVHILDEIGQVYLRMGKYQNARMYFKRALKLDDQYARTYQLLGELELTLENYEDAVGYYEKAFRLSPEDLRIMRAMSYLYMKMNRLEDALKVARKAFTVAPRSEKAALKTFIERLERLLPRTKEGDAH